MQNKFIDITEIARIANVHPSTVSRALNNNPRISEKTRKYIQEIAAAYGYIPDSAARGLTQGKSMIIGIIVSDISNSFYAHIISAIEKAMNAHGYHVIVGSSYFDNEAEEKCIRTMVSRRVDALVVCNPHIQSIPLMESISAHFPIIICDCLRACNSFDRVYVDEAYGVACAVNYLLAQGHTKLGSISDIPDALRICMFRQQLRERGLETPDEYHVLSEEWDYACGYHAVYHLYQQGTLPTALFCIRDTVAIGALRAAYELQLSVPQKLSVIGYDDGKLAEYAYRPLTTIHQPVEQIAENVVQCMLQRLEDPGIPPREIRLLPQLIIRQST